MKIPRRLKLIWCALWYGRIRFTVTLVGRDQTKGYMQRWVFHVDQPSQDFKVLRGSDLMRGPPVGDHYDAVVVDDLENCERTPVDVEAIEAVRDSPADLNDPDGPTLRDIMPPGSVHYVPHEGLTQQEVEEYILKDWLRRHTK